MTLLLAVRGHMATSSMSGPLLALQLHHTTVWCRATEGMWATQISVLPSSPTVPGRYADTARRTPNGPDSDPSPTACTPASAPGHVARCGRGGMAPAA